MPSPPKPRPIALRIELLGVDPLVWRRVLVPNQWTLASLHKYLQWIMGWSDSHAHEFRIRDSVVAPEWWISEMRQNADARGWRDERRVSIAAVAVELGAGGELEYRYDMGDGWRHRIVVDPEPGSMIKDLALPICVAGENACPPEDVGGPPGYALFLQIIADRHHAQHEDMLHWIGGIFDPKGFDLNRINRDWRGAKARRRR